MDSYVQMLGDGETVALTNTSRELFRYDSDENLLTSQVITPELPNGQARTVNRYDQLGYLKVTAVEASYGAVIEFETNAAGDVTGEIEYRRTSPTGRPVRYVTTRVYDDQGRLREVVDPVAETGAVPATIQYALDAAKGCAKVTSSSRTGATTEQWFNAAGWLVEEVNPFGGTTKNEYDRAGNRTHEWFIPHPSDTSLQPLHVQYGYDALNRLRVTRQDGPTDLVTYVDYMLPDETTAHWDMAVTNAAGGITLSLNDSLGQPILVMQPDPGPNDDPPTTLVAYDYEPAYGFQRMTTHLSTGGNGDPSSVPTMDLADNNLRGQRQFLDAAGRVLRSKVLDGIPDTAGSAFSPREEFWYDGMGRVMQSGTARVAADGSFTWSYTVYHHDDLESGTGQVKSAVTFVPDGPDSAVYYRYDSAGNPIRESDAANFAGQRSISRDFDGVGRLTWEGTRIASAALVDPLDPVAGQARFWEYRGSFQVYTDRNGEITVSWSDPATRQVMEYWFDAGTAVPADITAPFLVNATRTFSTVLTSDGRIAEAAQQESGANGVYTVTTLQYDAYGRPSQETQEARFPDAQISGGTTIPRVLPTVRLDTSYHPHGPRDSVDVRIDDTSTPDPADDVYVLHNEFEVDPLGRITSQLVDFRSPSDPVERQEVIDLIANQSIAPDRFLSYAYNVDHVLREFERFDSVSADPSESRGKTTKTFYPYGSPYNVLHEHSGTVFAAYRTLNDAAGNLKQRSLDLLDANGVSFPTSPIPFAFDEADRLSTDGTGAIRQYDASGNRTDGRTILAPNLQVLDAAFASLYDHEGRLAVKTSRADSSLRLVDDSSLFGIVLSQYAVDSNGFPIAWSNVAGAHGATQKISPEGTELNRYSATADVDLAMPGEYDVWLTWNAVSPGGTAQVSLTTAGVETSVVPVDFSAAPDGPTHSDGNVWKQIARLHAEHAGTLKVKILQDGTAPIVFDAVKVTRAAPRTTYQWDRRGRLVGETVELDPNATGGARRIEYGYDALNRLVSRTETVSGGTLPATVTWTGMAYDGPHRLFEFDANKDITRHWLWSEADGQILAVDESTPQTPTGDTEVVWMYADASGVVRTLAHVLGGQWSILHRSFTEEGRARTLPGEMLGDTSDTLLVNAPQVWNGLVFDAAAGHYLLGSGGAYDPLSGRSISDRGGANGYVLFGNNPVETHVAGSQLEPGTPREYVELGHAILDAIGVVDPFGVADGINALWYVAEDRYWEAGLSAVGALVPYGGDLLKLGRGAVKGSVDAAEEVVEVSVRRASTPDRLSRARKYAVAGGAFGAGLGGSVGFVQGLATSDTWGGVWDATRRGAWTGTLHGAVGGFTRGFFTGRIPPNGTASIVTREGTFGRSVAWFDQAAVLDDMATSPIGRAVLDAAESHQFRLQFSKSYYSAAYGAVEKSSVLGMAFRRKAKVYLPAHSSNAGVARTAIHEGVHMLGVRDSLRAEVLASAAEVLHTQGKVTRCDLLRIYREVRRISAYKKLPRSVGQQSPLFPGVEF